MAYYEMSPGSLTLKFRLIYPVPRKKAYTNSQLTQIEQDGKEIKIALTHSKATLEARLNWAWYPLTELMIFPVFASQHQELRWTTDLLDGWQWMRGEGMKKWGKIRVKEVGVSVEGGQSGLWGTGKIAYNGDKGNETL